MPLDTGDTLGPYKIIEQIGRGGMATVYKAYHESLDRHVAIKVIHSSFLEEPDFLARFQREARVVANLDHDNIIPIYDYAGDAEHPYLVMKLIPGVSLKDHLAKEDITYREMISILQTAGSALAYAHQQGILHRDVKPSNIILAEDGKVYLMDFGLARIAHGGDSSLTGDRLIGTPHYMSPEQALSSPELDARSDIYSLGVMAYEMATGRVPFDAETPFTIIHDHIYTPVKAPGEVLSSFPPEVERVLLKALEKKPENRYSRVLDFLRELAAAVEMDGCQDWTAGQERQFLEPATEAALHPPQTDLKPATAPMSADRTGLAVEQEKSDPTRVVQEQTQVSDSSDKIPPKKKKKRIWLPLLAILVVFCLLFSLFVLGQIGKENTGQTQTAAAQEQAETRAAENQQAEADALLDSAFQSWEGGDLTAAEQQLKQLPALVVEDYPFYLRAVDQYNALEEWLFAALILTTPGVTPPEELRQTHTSMVRYLAYMAAKNPDATMLLRQGVVREQFAMAEIRYKFYNGDAQAAQNELTDVFENEVLLKQYPEAKLLQVEIFLENGERVKARAILTEMIRNRSDYPKWVVEIAEFLNDRLQNN